MRNRSETQGGRARERERGSRQDRERERDEARPLICEQAVSFSYSDPLPPPFSPARLVLCGRGWTGCPDFPSALCHPPPPRGSHSDR
eukprot:scaffold116115_cov19-Tisochrysis_lutea.AAC.2